MSLRVKFLVRFGIKKRAKMTKKNKKILTIDPPATPSFETAVAAAAKGLIYVSETDAEIIPFIGKVVDAVTARELMAQEGMSPDEPAEETAFDSFFEKLTTHKDWHGIPEKDRAAKFMKLQETLLANLTELKVFRFGRVRVDIYIVGKDHDGRLAGVRTTAVET